MSRLSVVSSVRREKRRGRNEKTRFRGFDLNWCPEEDSNFHDRKVTST